MKQEIISWDQYFMMLAIASGMRSKDPSTQVGACIVSPDKKVISLGYNGLSKGFSDSDFNWSREGNFFETKYPYIVHAEQNAILNAMQSLKDAVIYVSLFPCHDCAKLIAQSGITKIVYMDDKYEGTDSNKVAKRILKEAQIELFQMEMIQLTLQTD